MGLFDTIFNSIDNKTMARMQFEHQKALQRQAYDLTQLGYRETPTNQRAGLESAGYNPILAVSNGVNFGSGMSAGSANIGTGNAGSGLGDDVNSVSSAYQAFKLNKQQVESQVALNNATKDNQTAQASLNQQNAISEQIKQDGYRIDNNIKSIEEEMKRFDKGTQEYRYLQDMKEQMSRIKLNNVSADAKLIDAHSNQISAGARVTNAKAAMISATSGSPTKLIADNIIKPIKNSRTYNQLSKHLERLDKFGNFFFGAQNRILDKK